MKRYSIKQEPVLFTILNKEFCEIPISKHISFGGNTKGHKVDLHVSEGVETNSSGSIYSENAKWIFECLDGVIQINGDKYGAKDKVILSDTTILFLCDPEGQVINSKFIIFQENPRSDWNVTDRKSFHGDLSRLSDVDCAFIDGNLVICLYDKIIFLESTELPSYNKLIHQTEETKDLVINVEDVTVGQFRNRKTLLKDINLTFVPGEMVLILGGSGAGKTTFLEAVTGLIQSNTSVFYKGINLLKSPMRHQLITLSPQLAEEHYRMEDTVYKNIDDAARLYGVDELEDPAIRKHVILSVLKKLDLESVKNSKCSSLSGGQKKKLTIAMEYITRPEIFFMDEPDSGVDGSMVMEVMSSLREIADEGKILCVITHTPDRIRHLFDRVIIIGKSSEGCGRLCYDGTVDEVLQAFEAISLEDVVHQISGTANMSRVDYFVQRFDVERRGECV